MTRRALLLAILAVFVVSLGYAAYRLETAIEDRRAMVADQPEYWRCEQIPDMATLRRVYVNRLMSAPGEASSSLLRGIRYWLLYPYVAMRVGERELTRDFLRTPSHYEKGCLPIPRENAMSAQ